MSEPNGFTPPPWDIDPADSQQIRAGKKTVAFFFSLKGVTRPEADANARRAAVCVNAFGVIPTHVIEQFSAEFARIATEPKET